jgi:membrane protease YdiL (CAAX protease family)
VSQDDPLLLLAVAALTGYVFYTWLGDYRRAKSGQPDARAFPGATACTTPAVIVAVVGALVLLGLETTGENLLGISGQQSNITVLFLVAMVGAAFGEELVVRGFCVVTSRGRWVLLGSILLFSLLFALAHPFFWDWKSLADGQAKQLVFDFSLKAWWSSGMVFLFSLWLYAMRFPPRNTQLNPRASLLPCIAAHLTKNLGVFVIKLIQGHVTGWWSF